MIVGQSSSISINFSYKLYFMYHPKVELQYIAKFIIWIHLITQSIKKKTCVLLCITFQLVHKCYCKSTISTEAEMSYYEPWKCSSRLSLNLMKMIMTKNITLSMPKTDNTTKFKLEVNKNSQSNIVGKSIVGTLISEPMTKKCDWS